MPDAGDGVIQGRQWKRSDLVGGHVVLDFMNTVSSHLPVPTNDRFRAFGDLLTWGSATGVLTETEALRLDQIAARAPLEAAAALGQARALRAILFDVFAALARRAGPDAERLRAFNDALRTTIGELEVTWSGDRLVWRPGDAESLDVIVRRIAWLAAQLMTSDELERLRRCAGDDCCWLFLDNTKNHSRRWCAMSDCGSREKARRYYRRNKDARGRG
jgi:predicted RNA-binding Zn ribbon-like protein